MDMSQNESEMGCPKLLLLFLLLHHVFVVGILEGLKDIGAKQGFADVIQLELGVVQVLVQADLKDFVHGAELQLRQEPAGQFFRVNGQLPADGATDQLAAEPVEGVL